MNNYLTIYVCGLFQDSMLANICNVLQTFAIRRTSTVKYTYLKLYAAGSIGIHSLYDC
jgi:hypothetical protein